jgi:hypothetical protein
LLSTPPSDDRKISQWGVTALIAGELVFNAACWIAAALTLGQADGLIGLALLAWVSNSKYAQEDRRVFY